MTERCLALLVLLFHSGLAAQGSPAAKFQKFAVELNELFENVFAEDLNQDGLKDIIVSTSDNGRRSLQIFYQNNAGFSDKPDDVLRFDDRVILYDFGDIAPEPGMEIVGLTRDALLYCGLSEGHYKPEPVKWMEVSSVLQSLSPECPVRARLFFDLEAGDSRFLFIPGPDQSTLLFLRGDGSGGNQKIAIRPAFTIGTNFRPSREDPDVADLSQKIGIRVPRLFLLDFNGDKKKDLLSIYKDRLQVFFNQDNARFAAEPDFKIDLEVLTEEEKNKAIRPLFRVEAVDLNNDGFSDVLVTKSTIGTTAGVTKLYIHLNREAQIKKTPDEVLMLENSLGFPQIADLNGDGHQDLIITELKFSLIQILKILITKKISYKEGIYLGQMGKFPTSPNFKLKSQMEFDLDNPESVRGEYMLFSGDFNGDGIKDLLQVRSSEKRLTAFAGNPKIPEFYGKQTLLDIRDPDLPSEFLIADLNGDKVSDIIFDFRRDKKKHLILYLSQR